MSIYKDIIIMTELQKTIHEKEKRQRFLPAAVVNLDFFEVAGFNKLIFDEFKVFFSLSGILKQLSVI